MHANETHFYSCNMFQSLQNQVQLQAKGNSKDNCYLEVIAKAESHYFVLTNWKTT